MNTPPDRIGVLLVENDPEFAARTAERLMEGEDRFTIERARTAADGLGRLEETTVDCVVSEYELPNRNGVEFLETVRDRYDDLPFILFTATGSEAVASDAISSGVTDYLRKHDDIEQFDVLANRIENAVETYRSRASLADRTEELQIYERIFNTMQEGACLYDEDGGFVVVNDYLADFYGTEPDALVGEPSDLIQTIRDSSDEDPYRELLEGERDALTGTLEDEFAGHGHAVLEYRLTRLRMQGNDTGVVAVARDVTERVERERELERARRQFEAVFDDPVLMVALLDADGSIEKVNQTAMETVDANRETVLDEPLWEGPWWTDQGTAPSTVERWIKRAASGEYVDFEGDIGGPDGTRTITGVFRPVTDGKESVSSIVVSARDITDRRTQQRELSETNSLLWTLFDTLPVGILAEDQDRSVLAANQRFFDLFDVSADPEAVQGMNCERFAHEVKHEFEDPSGFVAGIDERVSGNEAVSGEELELTDGRVFERSYRPLDLPEGSGHLWVYRDVTERIERAEALERSRAEFQDLIDGMNETVWVMDYDGTFLHVNDAAVETRGYSREELLEMTPHDIDVGLEDQTIRSLIDDMPEDGRQVFETAHETKNGDRIPVEISSSLITYQGEDAILSIGRDITERKERERRERLLRSLLGHDVRNLAQTVSGYIDLATDHDLPDPVEENLARAEDGIEDALDLIEKVNQLQKAQEEAIEPIRIGDPMQTCMEQIEGRGMDVEVDIPDADVTVAGGRLLDQVFTNIAENAIQHSGGDRLRISV
ncbi:MAG: PAS domain S-box protein, partial [Halodesulfurarchaeum sp.]